MQDNKQSITLGELKKMNVGDKVVIYFNDNEHGKRTDDGYEEDEVLIVDQNSVIFKNSQLDFVFSDCEMDHNQGDNSPAHYDTGDHQMGVYKIKEPIIGNFKPKKKFLNFVSAVNGARIRFISDVAFIKGEKLSGLGLENVIFKITLCDEGTIKFEEVDTNVTDDNYKKRLIEDICDRDVTGYAQKFIVHDLEFELPETESNKKGGRCYLEVEHTKPIDKLKSLFDEMDNKKEISDKGMSFLDELLGPSTTTTDVAEVETETKKEVKVETEVETKSHTQSLLEESFRKMNEDKINELKNRIEDKEKDVKKYKTDINHAESKLKESSEQLKVLNTRLETMSPAEEPNGYVFFVTEEQKNDVGLDETTRGIADKIADLMHLKKEILFDYLTGGFYKIRIGKKGENDKKLEAIENEIASKIKSIDPMGQFSLTDSNEIEYRGELNWHQLTGKMIRKGFEQDPEFNKISGSNSYESKTEEETKKECSHDNCGCSSEDKEMDKYKDAIKDMAKNLGMKDVKFGEEGIELVPEDKKTEFKTQTLASVKENTDLVIVGASAEGFKTIADFSITDDFSSFDIIIGDNKLTYSVDISGQSHKFKSIESDGFVNIMPVSEFIKYIADLKAQDILEDFFDAQGAVYLPNFKGDINLGVKDGKGNSDYEFDTNDYIQHQIDEYVDVIVSLPENTNAIVLSDPKQFATIFRDEKLNTILN